MLAHTSRSIVCCCHCCLLLSLLSAAVIPQRDQTQAQGYQCYVLDINLSKAKVPAIVDTLLQADTAAAATSFVVYNSGYQVFMPVFQIYNGHSKCGWFCWASTSSATCAALACCYSASQVGAAQPVKLHLLPAQGCKHLSDAATTLQCNFAAVIMSSSVIDTCIGTAHTCMSISIGIASCSSKMPRAWQQDCMSCTSMTS